MPTIVVQIEGAPAAPRRGARALRGPRGEIERLGKALGFTLRPMHAGSTDPTLASYHVIEVPDPNVAEELASRVRGMAGVKAAYVKPREEPP